MKRDYKKEQTSNINRAAAAYAELQDHYHHLGQIHL